MASRPWSSTSSSAPDRNAALTSPAARRARTQAGAAAGRGRDASRAPGDARSASWRPMTGPPACCSPRTPACSAARSACCSTAPRGSNRPVRSPARRARWPNALRAAGSHVPLPAARCARARATPPACSAWRARSASSTHGCSSPGAPARRWPPRCCRAAAARCSRSTTTCTRAVCARRARRDPPRRRRRGRLAGDRATNSRRDAVVLHPGVDLDAFTPAPLPTARRTRSCSARSWAGSARTSRWRSPRRMPELHVTLAGEPLPARTTSRPAARAAATADVRRATSTTCRAALASAHVLLHCADAEPYGLALVEALAAGRPVVAPAAPARSRSSRTAPAGSTRPATPTPPSQALRAVLADPDAPAPPGAARSRVRRARLRPPPRRGDRRGDRRARRPPATRRRDGVRDELRRRDRAAPLARRARARCCRRYRAAHAAGRRRQRARRRRRGACRHARRRR